MTAIDASSASPTAPGLPWRAKLAVVLLVILAVVVVLVSNRLLTDRYTADTKSRAEVRLALYTGNLMAELQRTSVVPLLLASDPDLGTALKDGNFSGTSAKLIALQDELGVASIRLVDADGRVVGATNRNVLGTNHRNDTYFVGAQRAKDTIFSPVKRESGGFDFLYSRAVMVDSKPLGVIIVSVDLMKYERAWAGLQDAIMVTDSEGTVMLSTEPRWRGLPMSEALALRDPPSAIARALRATAEWTQDPPDAYVRGEAVMKTEARVPFRGWKIATFTAYGSVREQVNGILALEIMGFAILWPLLSTFCRGGPGHGRCRSSGSRLSCGC
jgi:two-component system C4-dicarboxylate transport sensor histidine kinase DctB